MLWKQIKGERNGKRRTKNKADTWTMLLLYSQEIDHIKLSDIDTQMKETHKQPRNQILKIQATVEVQTVNWYKQQIEKQREKH